MVKRTQGAGRSIGSKPIVKAELMPALADDADARADEQRFNTTFGHSAVGTAVLCTSGEFVHVNQALCELIGYSAAHLTGMSLADVTHPADLQVYADQIQQLISGAADAYQVEGRLRHRAGAPLWVSLSVAAMRDRESRPDHLLVQVIDITAAREAEASLREANSRLKAILDNVPAWISLRSRDGRYLDANQQLADMYGLTKEALIGRYPSDLRPSQATADVVNDDRAIWQTGKSVERELNVTYPDGNVASFHTVRYPVFDDAGEIVAVGSFAMDVSDRKRADQLRDSALSALEEAQEIAQVGSWRWDAATDTADWSRELKRIFGLDPEGPAPSGPEFFGYVLRDDRRQVARMFRELLSGGPMSRAAFRIVARDGTERSVQAIAHHDDDHPGLYAGTVQDVTAARAIERDVQLAQERFRRAFEYAPVGMVISEPTGRSLQVNAAMCQMLGYTREQLLAINSSKIIHPDDLAERAELLRQLLDGEIDSYQREDRMLRSDGNSIWVSRHINLLRDEDGQVFQVLTQVIDISERRRMERELRHLADHDPLTGLLNRRGLEVELERQVIHANRYGARGALLLLDLDHFKIVNDTLGHEAGDRLIVSVAHLLRRRLRESDAVARLGGDEFAVLLADADAETAEFVANEILSDIQNNAAVSDGPVRRHVSASIGVTILTQGLMGGEEVLVNADLAMYDAKEAGRGRVAIHSSERHDAPRMKTRVSWMERIRNALDQDRLTVYGQPIMGLSDGTVDQYELLLRMIDESGEIIPPGAFLYVAERYDLVQELDQWVFKEAMRLLESESDGVRGSLAINVSGKSLGSEEFLATIEAELTRSRIEPQRLTFEVTETAAIANIAVARTFAERLQQVGCRFALDDFGAGFGSFFYLKHIPFDYLKIDREFVTNCLASRTDQLVIESLVSIARGLEKLTIAEGVEDQATEDFLRRNGVNFAQGYHIARPGPLADGIPSWDASTRSSR